MRTQPPPPLVVAAVEAADDAAARHVLADWLQESGDPSGAWLMSWLRIAAVDPERAREGQLAVHRFLFSGWPRQHAVVTWRAGFVRDLVVRLPGVTGEHVAGVLGHATLWLVETITFAAARLPLFELGVVGEIIEAIRQTGPHRRLRRVTLAGLGVSPEELRAAQRTLRAVAPELEAVDSPELDATTQAWLDVVDRHDEGRVTSLPGPFSPSLADALDDADEERLWLEHADWCDLRDDEPR